MTDKAESSNTKVNTAVNLIEVHQIVVFKAQPKHEKKRKKRKENMHVTYIHGWKKIWQQQFGTRVVMNMNNKMMYMCLRQKIKCFTLSSCMSEVHQIQIITGMLVDPIINSKAYTNNIFLCTLCLWHWLVFVGGSVWVSSCAVANNFWCVQVRVASTELPLQMAY